MKNKMAFCMGSSSQSQKNKLMRSRPSIMIRPPSSKSSKPSTSPVLTKSQKDKIGRQSRAIAALDMMDVRKKSSFIIKTNVDQTRFSKKDLKDLKDRFEKHSEWVLVDETGMCVEDSGDKAADTTMDQFDQSPLNDSSDQEILKKKKSTSSRKSTAPASRKSTQLKQSPIKKSNYKKIDISLGASIEMTGLH